VRALPLVLPFVILLFGGVPVLLLTRPARRARLAVAPRRALAAWWLLAAMPWIAAWWWILRGSIFTIDVASTTDRLRVAAAAVLALLVLVSLPAAVVTATWLRVRGPDDGGTADRRG